MTNKKNNDTNKNVLSLLKKAPLKVLIWVFSLLFLVILPYYYIILNLKFSVNYHNWNFDVLQDDLNHLFNSLLLLLILCIPFILRFIIQLNLITGLNIFIRTFILLTFGFMSSYVIIPIFTIINKTRNFKSVISGKFNDIIVETKLWSIQKEIDRQTAEESVNFIIESKVNDFPIKEKSEIFKNILLSQREKLIDILTTSANDANKLFTEIVANANEVLSTKLKEEVNTSPPQSYSLYDTFWKGLEATKQVTYGTFDLICSHPKLFICLAGLAIGSGYLAWLFVSTNASLNTDLAVSKNITNSNHKMIQELTKELDALSTSVNCQTRVITELQDQTLVCVEQLKGLKVSQTETTITINDINNNLVDQINSVKESLNTTNSNLVLSNDNFITLSSRITDINTNLNVNSDTINGINNNINDINNNLVDQINNVKESLNTTNSNLALSNDNFITLSSRTTDINTNLNLNSDTILKFSEVINNITNRVETLENIASSSTLTEKVEALNAHTDNLEQVIKSHNKNINTLNNVSQDSCQVIQQLFRINSQIFRILKITASPNHIGLTANLGELLEQTGKILNEIN